MKNILDKKLIESLYESGNGEFVENVNEFVYNLISSAVSDVSEKSPFVRPEKCILLPVNEAYTGAVGQFSQYTYFLGIENPQLESNSRKVKNFWKNLWREFRASWRIGRKKYKKIKDKNQAITVDKYQVVDFKHDIMKKSVDYLSESSIITEHQNCISYVGIDDFGTNVKVNVYVCCYDSQTGAFKLPLVKRNKFFDIDFGNRFVNLDAKKEEVGDIFNNILKIFNVLYAKNFNHIPNQIMIESLIFNCPAFLFDKNDIFKTFLNISNFVRISDPHLFKSICDENKTVFEEPLILKTSDQVDFNRVIAMLDNFKY